MSYGQQSCNTTHQELLEIYFRITELLASGAYERAMNLTREQIADGINSTPAGAFILFLCILTVLGTAVSDLLLAALDPRIRMED